MAPYARSFQYESWQRYKALSKYSKRIVGADKLNGIDTWKRGIKRRLKYYYYKLIRLRGTPHELALGGAFGIFVGMLPIVPFQIIVALALSFFFKASKITAVAGTLISNPITVYPIYKYCYIIGSFFLGFDRKIGLIRTVSDAISGGEYVSAALTILNGGAMVIAAFFLGGIMLGVMFAIPSYFSFFYLFKQFISWRKSKKLSKYGKI